MTTTAQLKAIHNMEPGIGLALMELEHLEKQCAANPADSMLRHQRNSKHVEAEQLIQKYRDLKNDADLCFQFGCETTIAWNVYCADHQHRQNR